jgi:SAM-dependent methyltransferase
MKENLIRHVATIFSSLQIGDTAFCVYECRTDALPEWANCIQLTHEFLVLCEQTPFREKIQRFLGKEIFEHEGHLYWFEGDRTTPSCPSEMGPSIITRESIDYLKTETALPGWLDDFIYNDLGAEYAPDFQRFEYNLDLTQQENLKYLGTYFPRSYAESFCIFDNIFQNGKYRKMMGARDAFNVLSLGCGTGGDLTGLLTAIEKYFPALSIINIWAIDGNKGALDILKKVVNKFQARTAKEIILKTNVSVFETVQEMDLSGYNTMRFDFILSFKMICEIIFAGGGTHDNSYYDFVVKFMPLLSDEGLCVLLDVTTKAEHAAYNPILMNCQVNQALREMEGYRTLLPLSCHLYEKSCWEECFTQQRFRVSHSRKGNDASKVSYRVIGKAELVSVLVAGKEKGKYVLQRNGQAATAFCPRSDGDKIKDGYKLNN